MKPTVAVYRSDLLPPSETFITAQAGALRRYNPVFCGLRRSHSSLPLPFTALAPLTAVERVLFQQTGYALRFADALSEHRPALLHAHFALDAGEALPLARGLGIPLLVTLHGYDVMSGDDAHRAHRRGRLFLARRERLWQQAAGFLCVSEAIRKRALAAGYPAGKLTTLPIGIDAQAFAKTTHPVPGLNLLFVGRLVPKKGCHILLKAMALVQEKLPAARLTIVGDGPERAALEAFACRHTRGTVFLGVQTPDRVRALMRASRCLAVPSLTAPDGDAEGLPTVLCEALALGLPVAGTFHSGIPELIEHGEHGLLSGEGDAEALARHLILLCTEDELVNRLREKGRERVETEFNLHTQTALLERAYDRCTCLPVSQIRPELVPALAASAERRLGGPVNQGQSRAMPAAGPVVEGVTQGAAESRIGGRPEPRNERLRRQAFWLFSGNTLALVFQAVYFLLIGRILGASEYGAFVGIAALIGVLSQFSSLGMEMVLLRSIARDRSAFGAVWGRALAVSGMGFALLCLVVWVYGRAYLPSELRILLPYLAVSDALFGKLTQLSSRALQGAGFTRWSARLLALTNAVRAGAAGLLLCLSAGAGHAAALTWARVYCAASVCVALAAAAVVTRTLGRPRWSPICRAHLLEGLSFSFSSSAITVYNDIDKSMLLSAGLALQAGIYGAAYRVVDVLSTPIVSLFAAASPRLFVEGAEGGPATAARGAASLLRWTVPFGLLAAPLLYFGAPLLPRAFGQSFQSSTEALRLLCLLPLLRGLHYAWGTAITASASQWWRTAAQAGVAGLNVGLNLALIPRWGWHGAAFASLLSDGALALASFAILQLLVARSARSRQRTPATRGSPETVFECGTR